MTVDEILRELYQSRDETYRDFQAKLLPTLAPQTVIGVRTPVLRGLAKRLYRENDFSAFLNDLPHRLFDENQLHAFLICEMTDFDRCMAELNRFLPFVDNWATCDQLSPKVFKKHRPELAAQVEIWLKSDNPYTVRFAIGVLLQHFLDEDFDLKYPQMVAAVHSDEYYVNMMIAWYFATALAKQYRAVLPFLEQNALERRTHNKAIQKALESYRVSDEQKTYLRTLKRAKTAKEENA